MESDMFDILNYANDIALSQYLEFEQLWADEFHEHLYQIAKERGEIQTMDDGTEVIVPSNTTKLLAFERMDVRRQD
jgi:hypothetical protein